MTVIETVLFSCIVYWMCGLNDADNGGRFGYFLLMCLVFYLVRKSPPHNREVDACGGFTLFHDADHDIRCSEPSLEQLLLGHAIW